MDMTDIIKEYLDSITKTDTVFAEKYDPAKMDECIDYIQDEIRNAYIKKNGRNDGGCGIKSDIVFKMARDFFIDGKAEINSEDVKYFKFKKKKPKTFKDNKVDDDEPEMTSEELEAMREQEKRMEEARLKRVQEERERKQYEKEHMNGQTTIFDLGA